VDKWGIALPFIFIHKESTERGLLAQKLLASKSVGKYLIVKVI